MTYGNSSFFVSTQVLVAPPPDAAAIEEEDDGTSYGSFIPPSIPANTYEQMDAAGWFPAQGE